MDGNWIHVEHSVPDEVGRLIIGMVVSGPDQASSSLSLSVTGDAEFVKTIAGLLRPFLQMEDHRTRLQINLQGPKTKRPVNGR